jgi:TolB protein
MANNHYPVWSPDERRIAFTTDVEAIARPAPNLYLMDGDGNNQKRLSVSDDADVSPSWSPDRKRIAWHRSDGEIYAIDLDTGKIRNLTQSLLVSDSYPSWFDPAFSISSFGKMPLVWGLLKTLK